MENKNVFNRIGKSISGYIGSKSKTGVSRSNAQSHIDNLNNKYEKSYDQYTTDIKNLNKQLKIEQNQEHPDQAKINSIVKDLHNLGNNNIFQSRKNQDQVHVWQNIRDAVGKPDKLEKTSNFLDKHATATGAATVGTGVIGTGGALYAGNKFLSKKDEPPKSELVQTPAVEQPKPEKSYARDNYRKYSEPLPEKHPDPTFLEKHGNTLSLVGGAAAAGLGAYALKKYLDKKKAKK